MDAENNEDTIQAGTTGFLQRMAGQRVSTGKADGGGGLGLPCSGVLTAPATQEGGGDLVGCEARHQGFADVGQLLIIISKLM